MRGNGWRSIRGRVSWREREMEGIMEGGINGGNNGGRE